MNEKELEKIKEIQERLVNKKCLTDYEKGQLDLIKELRKKQPKTRFEKILPFAAGCLVFFTFAFLFYSIYSYIADGSFAIERESERWAKKLGNQYYLFSSPIDEYKGVASIGYDCKPINKVTKGIQRCKGRYYIFLNKINNKWVVNESSKTIIW